MKKGLISIAFIFVLINCTFAAGIWHPSSGNLTITAIGTGREGWGGTYGQHFRFTLNDTKRMYVDRSDHELIAIIMSCFINCTKINLMYDDVPNGADGSHLVFVINTAAY